MTSIKFHFRPTTVEGSDQGRLFVRLIHKRRAGTIPTGYTLGAGEWDEKNGRIVLPEDNSKRKFHLIEINQRLEEIKHILELAISQHSYQGEYEVEDIIKSYIRTPEGDRLRDYIQLLRLRMISNGQIRTARAYKSSVVSFQKFMDIHNMTVRDFAAGLLKKYESWMLERDLKLNTVSFYMRNLRAIYNKAVAEKIIPPIDEKPFRDVYTGVYATPHRALTEEQLNSLSAVGEVLDNRIRECKNSRERYNIRELNFNLKLKDALDYFLFCFHARGMSYVDMAYLRKSDITEDTILYKRKKTGKFLELKVTEPMERIMERFQDRTNDSPYVFPVIYPATDNERSQYENGLNVQNKLLAVLTRMAGIKEKVTTHFSRHTWASVAKRHKIDIAVISEALGHSSIRTTQIYLDSFERSVLDSVSEEVSRVIKTGRKAA